MDLLLPPTSHAGTNLDDAEIAALVQILTSSNLTVAIQVDYKPTTALANSVLHRPSPGFLWRKGREVFYHGFQDLFRRF